MQIGSYTLDVGSVIDFTMIAMIGILVIICLIAIAFYLKRRKEYIYTAKIWTDRRGLPEVIMTDKARPFRVTGKDGASSAMYLKKLKRIKLMPNRRFFVGNTINFWIAEDGLLRTIKPRSVSILNPKKYLENKKALTEQESEDSHKFLPMAAENIDEKMALLKMDLLPENIRMSFVATNGIQDEMFNVVGFFQKWGWLIILMATILVMSFSTTIMLDGVKEAYDVSGEVLKSTESISESTARTSELQIQVMEKTDEVLSWLHGIKNPTT